MSELPFLCPNCQTSWPSEAEFCPNCGLQRPFPVWPPPPEGFGPPDTPLRPKTLTGQAWTDFIAGFFAQYLVHLATARVMVRYVPTTSQSRDWIAKAGAPGGFVLIEMFWAVVLGLLLYYAVRPFHPVVARGSGYALILLLVVLLGAFFICQPLLY